MAYFIRWKESHTRNWANGTPTHRPADGEDDNDEQEEDDEDDYDQADKDH
jgi:hypothetical protein